MFGLHNPNTVYPADIDSRIFFSDMSLSHADIKQGYSNFINARNYREASRYLYDNADESLDYNGAYVWNTFENRIAAMEPVVVAMDETNTRPYYSSGSPADRKNLMTWIS